jgi:hypothetical protein
MRPLLFGLLLAALAAPAFAQPARTPQKRQPQREARAPENLSPAQLHQLFDAMLAMQAQNVLALNDDQYAQFLTRLRALQDVRRRHQQERLRLINELQRMTNPRADTTAGEDALKQQLSSLDELESRAAVDLRRAYQGVDEVLSPLQRARFRVLEEQIERRKLELVGRARNRQNQQKR